MRRIDAVAFLSTALAVLLVNAVAAVAIGCLLYAIRKLYLSAMQPDVQDRLLTRVTNH
jgi:MFS superfamily sulfate permease-like transporter